MVVLQKFRELFPSHILKLVGKFVLISSPVAIFALSWSDLRKFPNLFFYDPSYAYLYNGVVITQGGVPGHTDHPGTSLQWISGITSQIFHASRDTGISLVQDVVANSDNFIRVNGLLLSAIFSLSVGVLGFRILKQLGAIECLIATVVFWTGFRLWYPQLYILAPESLVISSSILVVALVIPNLFKTHIQTSDRTLILIGILLSIGLTSKIIALPILVMFPFLLRPRQLLLIAVALVSTTMLILIPVYSRAGLMLGWFFGVSTKPSRWGQQTSEQLSIRHNFQDALAKLFSVAPQLITCFVGALILAIGIFALRKKNSARITELENWRPFIGILLSILTTLAMGFKQSVERDFVVLAVLVPVFVLLVFQKFKPLIMNPQSPNSSRLLTAMVVISLFGSSIITLRAVRETSLDLGAIEKSYEEVMTEVTNLEKSNWIASTYSSPGFSNAALFGAYWANNAFSKELIKTFPRHMELNFWDKTIRGWDRNASMASLDCSEINKRAQTSGLYILIPQNYLNDYWPNHSGSLRLNGQSLEIETERLIGNGLMLIKVGICKPD